MIKRGKAGGGEGGRGGEEGDGRKGEMDKWSQLYGDKWKLNFWW